MQIAEHIFRNYDIRGIYESELTNDLAYLIGKAFGTYASNTVIVGHDARTSSNALNVNLIKGLLETGVKVIDVGLVTTPMLYYARELFDVKHAIMITASHCDKKYNGFKLCDENGTMYGNKIKLILDMVLENNYNHGVGTLEVKNIKDDYVKLMEDKIKLGDRKLTAVVDCGNGTASIINPFIIEKWGVNVIPLYCKSDPSFPNHIPDPAVEENMKNLSKAVIKNHADLGIAFDGDGDRIGIVGEDGSLLKEYFMLIIWKDLVTRAKNKTASCDVKCSRGLVEGFENLGLNFKFNKTGHSYLKKAMKEENYDFSGEFSGHVCFNDEFYGYDDALYAAGRLLRILSNNNLKITDYLNDIPKYVSSKEIYIEVGEENKDKIVNEVLLYAREKGYEITDVDGVRIEYPDGFALVRSSNTSPSITVRFEGKTVHSMKKHQKEIMKVINKEL